MKAAPVTAASVTPNGAWQRILTRWRVRGAENGRSVLMLSIISPLWPTLEPKKPQTMQFFALLCHVLMVLWTEAPNDEKNGPNPNGQIIPGTSKSLPSRWAWGERAGKLVSWRRAKERTCVNGRKGVCAEEQWSSRGAVIQAGPSCRLA